MKAEIILKPFIAIYHLVRSILTFPQKIFSEIKKKKINLFKNKK